MTPPTRRTAARPASPATRSRPSWDVRIPARDGIELSANLWLPAAGGAGLPGSFPAILEMIPYGKDNWRRNADIARGTYLARRGYALCRVDVRGTGLVGRGRARRVHRGRDARRVRCGRVAGGPAVVHGAVGMWGISYGAFTSIQVAKLRPPHLRAIVPVQGTDDRYRTDVHYIGGCVTAQRAVASTRSARSAMNAMPPDPAFRGDGLARRMAAPGSRRRRPG